MYTFHNKYFEIKCITQLLLEFEKRMYFWLLWSREISQGRDYESGFNGYYGLDECHVQREQFM